MCVSEYIMCTVCVQVPVDARRGDQSPLQMVVSHHAVKGIEFKTSGRAVSALTTEPSLQPV